MKTCKVRLPDGSQETRQFSPLNAIVHQCWECMGWNRHEVKNCTSFCCSLYEFRLGDSGVTRTYTEEQKQAMRDRLNRTREEKDA